nr:MAG TPA: hypothetical protein [Bacteriophage sp.]
MLKLLTTRLRLLTRASLSQWGIAHFKIELALR